MEENSINQEGRAGQAVVNPLTIGGANSVGVSLADVKINFTQPEFDRATLDAINSGAARMRESFALFGRVSLPFAEACGLTARQLMELHERTRGKPVKTPFGILFRADAEGRVQIGGYAEDLEWMHGLLTVRYGPGSVSPIDRGAFFFNEAQAVRRNSRWMMYLSIP